MNVMPPTLSIDLIPLALHEIFGCINHRCHIIETKGESYRLKDAKRRSGKAQRAKKTIA